MKKTTTSKKGKGKRKSVDTKKQIDPILFKARNLRSSLLRRVDAELKHTTPTTQELYDWLQRDVFICYYSKQQITLDEVTVDHKCPVKRGGDNSLSNLCIASSDMNTVKGKMTEKEFTGLLSLVCKWEDQGQDLFRRIKMGHF